MKELLFWIVIPIILSSCFEITPEPHALAYQENEFSDLATYILDQKSIYEMDDFTRHYKSINDVSVKLNNNEGDQNAQLLDTVINSLKLDSQIVANLRIKLAETKLREFVKSGDTILFIVDGFLDVSWGFMYSRNSLKMDTTWFDFKGNSVRFVEDVNRKWKRASIR